MAFIIKDRVKEGTTSTGTGAITLGGAAATFDPFNSYMTNGDTTYYAIVHTTSGVDEWEVGLGTWNTGNTLTRTTVLAGSNGTSAVNFSAGNKDVFMTYPAAHAALAGDDVNFANITVTGTVDGRDVAADGTKLDTIETNADVTDAVNVAAAGALMKSGGTMTGALILNADPTTALGAATKEYVDTIAAAGIHYHTPVRVESPSALNATYDNGSSGVGATLTNAGTQAALVIDGVTVATNDRVLVYNQTNAAHNGIYTVTDTGSASTNWVLTRATDADSYGASDPNAMGEGDAYFVKEGDTGAGELYVMNTSGTITFGTTEITFTVIAETAVYSAGTGMSLNGTTFSIGQDVGTTANVTFNQVTAAIIGNVTGNLTGDVIGNADTATALETARTIQLSGDVIGSATFDGTANININAAVQDDSHAHVISNVDGLQAALDAKTDTTRTLTAGNGLTGGGDLSANRTFNVGAGTGVTVNADDIAIGQDVATTANVTFNQVIADNLRIGDWTGEASYAAVSHKNQTGTEYMMINNDGHTYISATTGSDVIIRGGNNTSTYELRVYPDQYATAANSTIITEAGSGLSKSSRTLSHADTSSQASVNNSNGTVIQDITLDTYGHITGINSVNLDGRYYTETEADSLFVNVTGDTMSGQLVIDDGNANPLELKRSSQVGIEFNDTSVGSRYLGVNGGNLWFGSNLNHGINNKVFHDSYHPNADKWTTARTLTLSGDASGSVSWDGSADATLSVTVANDSHSHSYYVPNNADAVKEGYLEIDHDVNKTVATINATNSSADAYNNRNNTHLLLENSNNAMAFYVGGTTNERKAMIQVGHENPSYAANTGTLKLNPLGGSVTINDNTAWHAGNDGSGSGLDADTVDGLEASSFVRSNANDTVSGNLSFSSTTTPISTNSIKFANTEKSTSYYTDQVGVLAYDANFSADTEYGTGNWSPEGAFSTDGGGLVFKGEDGWAGVIDTRNMQWLHFRPAAITTTTINGGTPLTDENYFIGKARSLGWYPAYNNSTESTVKWDDAEEAVALYSSSDANIGMAFKAIYAKKGQVVRFTVPIKSSAAYANNLYVRLYAHGGDLPDGKFAVSNDATHPNVQEDDYSDTGWYESGAHTTSWRNFERSYVMPADGYVSLVILNWTNFTGTVYAKQPDIQMVSDFTYTDSNRNIKLQTNSTDGAGGITLQSSDGDFQFQLYGTTGSYGFLDANWGSWDIRKYTNGAMYLNGNTTYYLQPETTSNFNNLTMNGALNMVTTGSLYFPSTAGGYIPHPRGGSYTTGTSSVTGAIKIAFPTAAHGATDMLTFWVDIFDYTENESVTLFIAGYLYQATGSNEWVNCEVVNITGNSNKDYTVRFGADGTRNCVWIGETNSTWSYPQVLVRDLHVGYTASIDAYDTGFAISFATAFDTVDETFSNNFPQARNSQQLGGYSSGSYLRSDATDNVSGHTEWQDNYEIRLGDSADFRMYHNSSNSHTYFKNYNHAGGNIYFQGEDAEGTNHGLLYMYTNVSRPYTVIHENGSVRLTTKSYGVDITGELRATSNITAYYSDERLKTKVGGIENPLDKVKSLEGFYYVENDVAKEHGFDNEEQQVALSAQAVQAVMPEAVDLAPFDTATDDDGNVYSKSGEEYLTVDYARLVPLLVESIKELEKRVAELEAKQ